jgi:hypothetical protein
MHIMTFEMIQHLYAEGYTIKQISKMVGCSRDDVERAIFDEPDSHDWYNPAREALLN